MQFKNSLERKSVLIVEDDAELAYSFASHLNMEGYLAIAVGTVNDAIKKLENQKFHLIVVDMHLGNQTGERVIHVVRKDICGLNIRSPILVCSGQLESKIFENIKHHIDDAMVKPFPTQELITKANYWTNMLSTKTSARRILDSENKAQILVVDDDRELANNMCTHLNFVGYNAVACYTVLDTKLKIARQKFDCILMDRHIKQRECVEIIKPLRIDNSSPNQKTPVIVMTGDMTDEFVHKIHTNVQGFIRKPIITGELPNVVNYVMERDA